MKSGVLGVIAANVFAIAIAWWQHWPLLTLLWPYWLQSLIIGWYSRQRILSLAQFSREWTSGFDQGSDEATKRRTARLFAFHYGGAHLIYALYLWGATTGRVPRLPAYPVTGLDVVFMAIVAVSFALSHRATYRRIIAADQHGRPNIGLVLWLPYLRILPMHVTVIIAGSYGVGLFVFGTLKIFADALMHWIEYRITSRAVESTA